MSATMAKALRVELELPDDAFGEDFDQETFCAKVREAAVMRLLREHRISQGKAAELLGLSRDQCLGLMASHGVPVVDLSPEKLELELRQAEAVFRRHA